jgi:hypothetical protein
MQPEELNGIILPASEPSAEDAKLELFSSEAAPRLPIFLRPVASNSPILPPLKPADDMHLTNFDDDFWQADQVVDLDYAHSELAFIAEHQAQLLQFNLDDFSNYISQLRTQMNNLSPVTSPLPPPNQAPVNTFPNSQTAHKNMSIVFNSANSNLIRINDVDAGANSIEITLNVSNGSLTLSGVAGLLFSVGDGSADGNMRFTGNLIDINNALRGMQFTPNNNFVGNANLQIISDDLGHTGSGGNLTDTDTISINIDDANVINNQFAGANSLVSVNLDGDADQDVLGAAGTANDITWFENTAGNGTTWLAHTIDSNFSDASSVLAFDIDGDGDQDVFAAGGNTVAWWEDTDGSNTFGARNTINSTFTNLSDIQIANLDGDADFDIVAVDASEIAWIENAGGGTWIKQTIDNTFNNVTSVFIQDINNDGSADVIATSLSEPNPLAWWDNGSWTKTNIPTSLTNINDAFSINMDGDGDFDIVAVGSNGIRWYENDGPTGNGSSWTEHSITTSFNNISSVYVIDLDGDTDLDIIASSNSNNRVSWWENDGTNLNWTEKTSSTNAQGVSDVYAGDADSDADLDILWTENTGNIVAWDTVTPIVLDLDNDGVEFTQLAEAQVYFDVDGDGVREHTSWVGADDGLLTFDYNSDGVIDQRQEIAFADYLPEANTDLQGLHYFDSNHDGMLDQQDQYFSQFYLWQDVNQDGISDPGELFSLQQAGISAIALSSDNQFYQQGDISVFGMGTYHTDDGKQYALADSGFRYNNTHSSVHDAQGELLSFDDLLSDNHDLFTDTTFPSSQTHFSGVDMDLLLEHLPQVIDDTFF